MKTNLIVVYVIRIHYPHHLRDNTSYSIYDQVTSRRLRNLRTPNSKSPRKQQLILRTMNLNVSLLDVLGNYVSPKMQPLRIQFVS